MTEYTPLERYGIIGNLETCALVGDDGSIDWFPLPHVESPSAFAALLDANHGGRFRIHPTTSYNAEQRYVDRTNVLQTVFKAKSGEVVLTDFMPVFETDGKLARERAICRRVTCSSGSVEVDVAFAPRFDYARDTTTVKSREHGVVATGEDARMDLASDIDLQPNGSDARGTDHLTAGETRWLVLSYEQSPHSIDADHRLNQTLDYWRGWAHTCNESRCIFAEEWHDLVVRSQLVLKLLIHHDTGAICAAPTTSLPEEIGGVRNWDYRYNWIRDAAFTIQALVSLLNIDEAREYIDWFLDTCHLEDPSQLQPLYGLHGETALDEQVLDHLSGYRNSAPVRIGNQAAKQRQLDTYGELVLAICEASRMGLTLTETDWDAIRLIVEYVCDVWPQPGAGIWEVRSEPKHFVFSKVMCWIALDRGIEMATEYGFDAPLQQWRETRRAIKRDILKRGFNRELNSFVRAYDEPNALDATGLLIPVVGFLPVDDPRVQGTITAIQEQLMTDDGWVRRYNGEDGLPGEEGVFVLCSFWLVDALALSGRITEAQELFTKLLGSVSPLGLLAEEIDSETGMHLGNTPQAFSHIGIINSALYLGKARGHTQPGPDPMGTQPSHGQD